MKTVTLCGQVWPSRKIFFGELLGALSLFVIPYLFCLGYYAATGHYLDFGGQ